LSSYRTQVACTFLSTVRTDSIPKVRFSATVGEEPEVEVTLINGHRLSHCLGDLVR
jgi:hypothetical protein